MVEDFSINMKFTIFIFFDRAWNDITKAIDVALTKETPLTNGQQIFMHYMNHGGPRSNDDLLKDRGFAELHNKVRT